MGKSSLDDAWEYESDHDFWSQSAHEQNQHTGHSLD